MAGAGTIPLIIGAVGAAASAATAINSLASAGGSSIPPPPAPPVPPQAANPRPRPIPPPAWQVPQRALERLRRLAPVSAGRCKIRVVRKAWCRATRRREVCSGERRDSTAVQRARAEDPYWAACPWQPA
jgi:hypothetical protein